MNTEAQAAPPKNRRYFHLDCAIIGQREIAQEHFVIRLSCPEYDGDFSPGQFVNLKCDDTPYGRLYRPFSILRYLKHSRTIEILYKVVGSGTMWLKEQPEGAALKILLPLGNAFTVPNGARRVALVAGGVGIAPMIFLAEHLRNTRPQADVLFLMGARAKDGLCIPLFEEARIDAEYATEDGSFGHNGLVTDLLRQRFTASSAEQSDAQAESSDSAQSQGFDYIACCGPTAMMAEVQHIVEGRCKAEASLEERMACGIGACFGCVQTIREDDGTIARATTCRDGPVFPLDKVVFEQ